MGCLCSTSRTSTAAAAHAQAKPRCPNRCGDVEIPYPFGTKRGCFLNKDFLITCNDTFNPPKPFLGESNIHVVNISIDGHLNVLQYTAKDCYNAKGYSVDSNVPSITLSNFTVSNTENRFVVIGCDSYAYVRGYLGENRYRAGCMSLCDSFDFVTNGSCVGIGCCQIEIPTGLKGLDVVAHSYNNHTNVSSFNPCTYAFVVDQSQFHFASNYLEAGGIPEQLPIVLDWEITTNETCEEAKVCGLNASCDKPKDNNNTSSGYHCKCNKGYEGNPYLSDGCQDINECEDPSLNNCTHTCDNIPGSYTCRCRKGFHGDGRKDGGGCTPNQYTVIKVALVYEFVGNGTLFEHIHKNGNLSWERRLRIAAETAGVLSYLHSETNVPIIHRDVKSANILLDENYTPKVSDFGASKLVPIDAIQNYTDKSDVYSFGVVLVELLTGKMALLSDKPEEERSLAMNFLSSLKQNRLLEILDNRIVNDGNKQQLKVVAELAARCINVRGEERPTMKEVALELQGRLSLMSNGQYYLRDNVESNGAQETEYFTSTFYECRDGIGSHTTPTDGYDSMQQLELMAFDDGR
ncbi:hypothetical protein CICLE_v10004630mg [Citrus x clementina]|uniref:Protein kinase domain-containing protein n=1 Tax=Citrus clementina TaxID=85681 RepID=V4RKM6_CITCL|nr:hypothetical protein CICLE_v10004630mg [Citrus x clementina]